MTTKAIDARSDETRNAAQPERRERGAEGMSPNTTTSLPKSSETQSEEGLREALERLQQAEAEYRLMHDRHGDGSKAAGRAWDLMRRAGDKARATLSPPPEQHGESPSLVALRGALEKIELLSTNHGGWFENDPWAWGQMMGDAARAALILTGKEATNG